MTTQTSAQSDAQTVKERAASVGGTVQDQTGQVAGTAKEQAVEVAQEAKAQARDLLGELRGQVRQQTGTQRDRLVEILREFGDELENMAESGGGSGTATEVVRQVSQRLRDVQNYFEGGSNLGEDIRTFARRRPGTFLLGCAAAGVLAGRATRGAAAAKRAESSSHGRHVVDVRPGYGTEGAYGTEGTYGTAGTYGAGTTGTYGGGAYAGGETGFGTAEGAPTSGIERTSDPNIAPSSGPLAGDTLTDPTEPVPPGTPSTLGGRDASGRDAGIGYEGTR